MPSAAASGSADSATRDHDAVSSRCMASRGSPDRSIRARICSPDARASLSAASTRAARDRIRAGRRRILAAAHGARRLGVTGLVLAAIGTGVPAFALGPVTAVVGVAVAAAGTGAMFVVASATALGQVAPEEADVASGIVSTFPEFGASVGAAAISSVAAAGLVGDSLDGFERGFAAAAVVALAAAGLAAVITPARPGVETRA